MKRTEYLSVSARLIGVVLVAAVAHAPALAQSDGIKSLDGTNKTGGGKVLTREELRVCMKQQDELASKRTDLEARRAALNQERDAIQAENQAIQTEQASLKDRNSKVKEYNDKLSAFAARVDAYNKGMEELQEMRAGPFADRRRKELDKEQAELKRIDAANKAEGAQMQAGMEGQVNALNARVDAQGKKATDWNARSKTLDEEAAAYEDKRIDWKLECGNRRYKEDDEKAIKAGK
ncbi:MAG: hypothetical protein U1F53_07690 [Burkholderiaceae bacterium]